eukprot:14998470-Alexandrium_andersonii.AAC.1
MRHESAVVGALWSSWRFLVGAEMFGNGRGVRNGSWRGRGRRTAVRRGCSSFVIWPSRWGRASY